MRPCRGFASNLSALVCSALFTLGCGRLGYDPNFEEQGLSASSTNTPQDSEAEGPESDDSPDDFPTVPSVPSVPVTPADEPDASSPVGMVGGAADAGSDPCDQPEICDGRDNDCNGIIDDEGCPPGCSGETADERGYMVCVNNRITWQEARDACLAAGLDLVRVDNEAENQFLLTMMERLTESEFWLGASDQASEGVWVWVTQNEQFWQGDWTGGPVGDLYNVWSAPEPNNNNNDEDCAALHGGREWNDRVCDFQNDYVCEALD